MSYMVPVRSKRLAKEYQITVSTTPTAAQQLLFPSTANDIPGLPREIIIAAKGTDVTFKFGGSNVASSNAVTSNALVDGNFTLMTGAIYQIELNNDQQYVSVVGAGAGTAIITLATTPA